jgi:hypothetical protein
VEFLFEIMAGRVRQKKRGKKPTWQRLTYFQATQRVKALVTKI